MSRYEARCVECTWTELHESHSDAATGCLEHAALCIDARTEIVERGADVVPEPRDDGAAWIPGFGLLRQVHDEQVCSDRESPCVIHRPSAHHLRTWKLGFGLVDGQATAFRVCPHDVAHPDPDEYPWRREDPRFDGVFHTCDGCCAAIRQDEWLSDEIADEIEQAAQSEGQVFDNTEDLIEHLRSDDPDDDHDLSAEACTSSQEGAASICYVSNCDRRAIARARWVFATGYESTHDYCGAHVDSIATRVAHDLPAGVMSVEVIGR